MALTGNIEIFPLPEILRLLARSGKNGCLRVDTGGTDGRIYLQDGSMTLATVWSDGEVLDQFAASGVVDLDRLGGREIMDLPAAIANGSTPEELGDAVREHIVESLYRIRRPGHGSFEFLVDRDPRFRTGQRFDVDAVVADSDRRAADWADIEGTIEDLDLPVRMARELSVPEVNVNAPTWRVLSVLEGGATVREIARLLGTTEFRAAREVAGLIRSALVEGVPTVLGRPSPEIVEPEIVQPETDSTAVWVSPMSDAIDDEGSTDPAASPWSVRREPEAEDATSDPWTTPDAHETGPAEAATDMAQQPSGESDRSAGWWAEAMGETDDIGEVDTDEFLESVFADETSSVDDESEETGFSMGLLRRRRLGPVTRDMSASD